MGDAINKFTVNVSFQYLPSSSLGPILFAAPAFAQSNITFTAYVHASLFPVEHGTLN